MINKTIIYFLFLFLCCVKGQEYLDLPEGSKCSKDGVDGVCASVYYCLNAAEDIKNKDYPSICTYKGKVPIICCTDCELVNDTRTMFISPTSGRWYYKNGQKARDNCLEYMKQLDICKGHFKGTIAKRKHEKKNCYVSYPTAVGAVGGGDAYRQEYPHIALLGYGEDEDSAQWLCGGSLISERFILTAGHCTSSPQLGSVKYIALGILKRTDPSELWQKYTVSRIIKHPDYKPPSKYNDIALLKTGKRVSFNSDVIPACLHFESSKNDDTATAIGWGALGNRRELANTLQSVWLEEFNKEDCKNIYPQHRHLKAGYNHDSQMCYGSHQEIKDTCEGDSGGPLQNKFHINSCQFTVIGVTSSGRQCGQVGSVGLYTRVLPYLSWIEETVWP